MALRGGGSYGPVSYVGRARFPGLWAKTDRGLAKYLAVNTKTKTPFHYLLGQGGADWGGQE